MSFGILNTFAAHNLGYNYYFIDWVCSFTQSTKHVFKRGYSKTSQTRM